MNVQTMTRQELEAAAEDISRNLASAEASISAIKTEMESRLSVFHKSAQTFRTMAGQVQAELLRREAMDAIVPTISDHALLRYIERVHGIDVEAMKAELLTETVVHAIKAGATAVRSDQGTFVIRGSTVTTFLAPDMRPKRKTKRGLLVEADIEDLKTEGWMQ